MTIPIKNRDGIARMREACAIAATVLDQLKPLTQDISDNTAELSDTLERFVKRPREPAE